MKSIGLLSDTHGYLDDKIFSYFVSCDEVWHAGDIGDLGIARQLESFKPLKAVYGNIDGKDIRDCYAKDQVFYCENLRVLITHIAALPPKYNKPIREKLTENNIDLLVCGHSHICKVMKDPVTPQRIYMNPGALGRQGFHHMRTALRFAVSGNRIVSLEVIEFGKRGG